MKENPSFFFENLSDDVLDKEPPTDFFDTESSRLQLRLLSEYVREERSRPIFITGPAGFGKTRLVRQFVTRRRPPRTEIAWIDYTRNPDQAIDELILRLREGDIQSRVLVVLDGVEGYSWQQLKETLNRLFNWKRVRNVIITTRTTDVRVRGAREIPIGPPEGKLYGLKDQLIVPQKKILASVAPLVVTANDQLIEKLRRKPDDLFKISPRQFEEVIADILTDMGMEVELTPATRDGGKDILAYMSTDIGKFLCLVEAKRYSRKRPVDVSLVRALFGTLVDHEATSGMLVTTSGFGPDAKSFQERHKYQLSLRDYTDVVEWLMKYKTGSSRLIL
jgi:restriction system protein